MTDPERFRTGSSDLERHLFASMEDDVPPPGARDRMLAALGAAAVLSAAESVAAATAASKGAPGLGWVVIAKWMATGAATAFVTVGTGVVLSTSARSHPTAASPAARPAMIATPRSTVTPLAPSPDLQREVQNRTEHRAVAEAREHPGATASPARARPAAPASEGAAPRASATVTNAPPPASDLAREVTMLDDVQRTLDRGDARGALRQLDLYTASFPAPSLGPEATLLRVQALLGSGDRPGAEALGRAFIARNPRSQHAERIQSLLAPASAPAGRLLDQSSRPRAQRQ